MLVQMTSPAKEYNTKIADDIIKVAEMLKSNHKSVAILEIAPCTDKKKLLKLFH